MSWIMPRKRIERKAIKYRLQSCREGKMNIGVIGTGYVGLVQGVILAEAGMNVICMDVDKKKIETLKAGNSPIYEPGLNEMINKNLRAERIAFTTDMQETVDQSEVIFIAVGTPQDEDGSADLHYVINAAKDIASHMKDYKVIVTKSTVPVGTGQKIKKVVKDTLLENKIETEFDIVSNPEFLREGKAIRDCSNPDRIVIGTESERARTIMENLYDVFNINKTPFVFTNIETSELIKYASNAFLAVKISYINELALLAEKVGADIQVVASAMGMDGRISPKFLHAGPGYGGSCFPKDTRAIVKIAEDYDTEMKVIQSAIDANEKQKQKMVEKIINGMSPDGNLKGKTIAILGLSFKPETDDMREAPSIDIIRGLVKHGAMIQAFCPEGMKEAEWRFEDIDPCIKYMNNEYDAAKGADALVIVTEWFQFRSLDLERIHRNMKDYYFFDLRNCYVKKRKSLQDFHYYCVGIGEECHDA